MSQVTRRRKISLQNDYAYCIISPVSPSVVLIQPNSLHSSPSANSFPSISVQDASNNNNADGCALENPDFLLTRVEEAEEAYLSLETNSKFRRWSFCNYQTSGIPVSAGVAENIAIEFGNNDGYGFKLMGSNIKGGNTGSNSGSNSSSSTSLSKISGIISNIPDRIRKISSGSKFDVQSSHRDEELRDQMKKLVVY